MPMLDIFNTTPFSMTELTTAINKMPYQPMMLGQMGLFAPKPTRFRSIAIEKRDGQLRLIPVSEVGAPPTQQNIIRRDIRDFRTYRLFKQDHLQAHEIQGARAFGSETELETMTTEVSVRMGRLLDDLQLTEEYHRLGAIQGKVLDADGTTVVRDWFAEWGVSEPSEITFSNTAVTNAGDMRTFLNQNIVRPMLRAAKAGPIPGIQVKALCGDNFYDWFRRHADVKPTYSTFEGLRELREKTAWTEFSFGEVDFINYRGTDDNSTVAIGADKVRFFLDGVPDLFQVAYSPAESFGYANTRGQQYYARTVVDTQRDEFVDIEVMSYPLFMCTRPETLLRGTL